ncbi:MAG: acyl-CoA dehydrogenase [Candidatus Thermofonsia Clade 1 bacterium]|jgi:alkylation response protein AidB-like acyl-CoA dehydrogenase|uniref:Acyl-CoA dehydrogenase n=1 Tax=Candidatus Thermofonsia Clade 1 bacterium TaxID=2364210 RepID=A0A2M8PZ07_9CHLR|nr:MAG: acyl-CoA dehydrogenase [Candidatus Thermofonsia Clade 1 bacterium]PJF42772.1 MAG: acyl-CoA dehydrogenase [Candidatus Thermofonsia Clade 1 bacterium]RMF52370.1 MAG: acyl-CoA dehydrogenase [Chloroflexota bacterium]
MLSFTPTDEQQMLMDAITKLAAADVRAHAHDADEEDAFPPEILQKGWELGILPASIPEAYGGFGEYSALTNVLAAETLAWGDLAWAMAVMLPATVANPVYLSGTEEQKQRILPQIAAAETLPYFSTALLEAGISFDTHALRTIAKREGDHYTISGEKCYVPFAPEAQMLLVYAQDSETGKVDGYLIERGAEGLMVTQREKLMGIRALPTYRVQLNNVRLSAESRLGGEAGTRYERILSHSRTALAALAVGVARAAYEYARDYAKTRVQFGVPIAQKQSIAFMLAEMAIEVDAARMMTWEAAWQLDNDPSGDHTAESYMAKEYAAKAALFVTDCAVQTLGGHGYIREHPVERWLRNARGFTAFEGLASI